MKIIVLIFLVAIFGARTSNSAAFSFSSPKEGHIIAAGTTLKVSVDPGDLPPLFGVLLISNQGIIKAHLDSSMPFEWTIQIPLNFHGPLTLRAIGRRYIPVPNPPQTSVTIHVVFAVLPLNLYPDQNDAVPLRLPFSLRDRGLIEQDPPSLRADLDSHS